MFSSASCSRSLRDIVGAALDARGEAAELLAERDRHGVLQMRAAGLEHVGELVGLSREALRQRARRVDERLPCPSSSASRVAVGKTSLVDWPMLT